MRKTDDKPVVLISDLHVDRWDRKRKELFFDFLDHVESAARELYVLGDLLDFPALKGESIWPRHSEVISRLRALPSKGVPLTYLIGNHDISLRGIELSENGFTMTYCDAKNCFNRVIYGKNVFMDHGHFHDPLFKDHIYEAMDFLREVTGQAVDRQAVDFLRDVVRIFQRRPKHKDNLDHEKPSDVGVPESILKTWETAAEHIFKKMQYDVIVFGHTHAPGITPMSGGDKWYVNTGDWIAHATYVEMTPGKITLRDWETKKTLKEAVV